mmetsp:Transcript_28064/g.62163  ORF Transcript_28064/g.62163 Transcript_28064/m.62163 type:complete len:448 (+) Transcript_28064:79-1422(+)|eukprot:CAMPEP_0173182746 /NCGR_PEP_ID=MMETSP1141-20130122/8013_1 /TAXON_ID=483371 /ORGANISM="non described non described, Strain CCMP2298" /LENGTH=447 /DNA_ID=CAMNT_0014105883 /DNA_START=42 /DNA_END=1385 /DNA_ORIENTATION=+
MEKRGGVPALSSSPRSDSHMWCVAETRVGVDGVGAQVTKPIAGAETATATLLDKQFKVIIPCVIVLFIGLMLAAGLNSAYASAPVCDSDDNLAPWVDNIMAAAAACAALTCVLTLIRILTLLRGKLRVRNAPLVRVNLVLFVLNGITGCGKTATFLRYGGICVDKFGVFSPADQWAEWILLVPLLQYVVCAVEQKAELSAFDITMIALLALMVLAGALMNIQGPLGMHIFFLAVSFSCLIGVTYMSVTNYNTVTKNWKGKKLRMTSYFPIKQTLRKATLLMQLNLILWYYPAVWVLAAGGAIGADWTFALYMMGGIFGKVIFSSLVVESHVALLYEYLLLTAANTQIGDEDESLLTQASATGETSPKSPGAPGGLSLRRGVMGPLVRMKSQLSFRGSLATISDDKEKGVDRGDMPMLQRFDSSVTHSSLTTTVSNTNSVSVRTDSPV